MSLQHQPNAPTTSGHTPVKARLEWIDAAKGIAITLVVLGHVVWVLSLMDLPTSDFWRRILQATGPMRMPGFFLMSGLFAHRFASGSFERFARRRVIGFAYLFVVWLAITAVVEVGLQFWLHDTAKVVSRTKLVHHILWLETPLWYLIALPAFHLLWWGTRKMAAWVPLTIAGIGYVLVETGVTALPGMLGSTGYRGMIQYAFFFMVGARLSQPLRDVVGRMTPWTSAAVVTAWLAMEIWIPTLPMKSLVAVPALFAISQLVVLTPLRSAAQRAGRRTLPLYLMNWLAVAIVGGIWLQLDVPSTRLTQFLVPGITLPVVIALIASVWHLTRDIPFLYAPSKALEDKVVNVVRSLNDLEPASPEDQLEHEPMPDPWTGRPATRAINVPMIHAHRSMNHMNR
ncbi:MAG: acyltransferase [Propionibacteriaceae bacterium]|nr:acyltransferase [Propionibacteriaceae bacterium]